MTKPCLTHYKKRLRWAKMRITVENVLNLEIETCEAKPFKHTRPEDEREKC